MRARDFKKAPPGTLVNPSEFNRMGEVVQRLSNPNGANQGSRTHVSDAGVSSVHDREEPINAVINGINLVDGVYHYGWREFYVTEEGKRYDPGDSAREGYTDRFPAFEMSNKYVDPGTHVLLRWGDGEWMEFHHCCGEDPTTTTTTTTTPPGLCSGDCQWSWDNVNKRWVAVIDVCSDGCSCVEPSYCGRDNCEITRTSCFQEYSGAPLRTLFMSATSLDCSGTTAAPTTTTSTTTTLGPDCSGGCSWRYYDFFGKWMLVTQNCSGNCPCTYPPSAGSDCDTAFTPCVPVVATTTVYPCSGTCRWIWNPDAGGWVFVDKTCDPAATYGCVCSLPTILGDECTLLYTPCVNTTPPPGGTPAPTLPPTTTTLPVGCTGECVWKWDGAAWVLNRTNCPGSCGCDALPPFDGSTECETFAVPCNTTTTTTTTSTTTTSTTTTTTPAPTTTTTTTTCGPTTTPSNLCGVCHWQWTGFEWLRVAVGCTSGVGCVCTYPSSSGDATCNAYAVTACTQTTPPPTTTCNPGTTTLPPAPCTAGFCMYRATSDGSGNLSWILHQNACSSINSGLSCICSGAPACPPTDPSQFARTPCLPV